METYYEMFKEIRRRKIDSRQITHDYGGYAAFLLNGCCPIVIKRGGIPLDVLAAELGFESANELYETILNYKPKYKWEKELRDYEEEI